MMSKRDYEALAAVFEQFAPEHDDPIDVATDPKWYEAWEHARQEIGGQIVLMLSDGSPRFSASRFREAAKLSPEALASRRA